MYSINKTYIDELLKYGEHVNLECKKAEHDLPKSIWESYSAFANTDGGYILLGIEEISKETLFPEFHISGITNVQKMIKTIWDTIKTRPSGRKR